MSLSYDDYKQIDTILSNFAKELAPKMQSKREVTIPLDEYECIRKNEDLYYKKIRLLQNIEEECKMVLNMKSQDWDNEELYKRIYKIYEMICKDW